MNATAWQGPPTDILGRAVPIQQFVARTDHTVVALQHVIAFPEGCILTLHVAVQRGSLDEPAWNGLVENPFAADPELTPTEGHLKLGVRFPDGSRATTVDHAFRGWAHPTDRPEPPMLIEADGESSSSNRVYHGRRQLWLWPLPPPDPFEFVIEWHSMGIGTTSILLDGGAIVRAAQQALPYWP
ncbi:MAG: hypothetical protein JWM19_26 [Actinomycetia bacterium]|nr:hypothetical protein [Actinomycetes bacterium]